MQRIKVDLPEQMVTDIDAERGSVPRSAYIRDVLNEHLYSEPAEPAARTVKGKLTAAETVTGAVTDSPPHRHVYEATGVTRRNPKGRGLQHEQVCLTCPNGPTTKWEIEI